VSDRRVSVSVELMRGRDSGELVLRVDDEGAVRVADFGWWSLVVADSAAGYVTGGTSR